MATTGEHSGSGRHAVKRRKASQGEREITFHPEISMLAREQSREPQVGGSKADPSRRIQMQAASVERIQRSRYTGTRGRQPSNWQPSGRNPGTPAEALLIGTKSGRSPF